MTKLRDLLWEIVPESRERILSLENELIEEGTPHLQVGTLTYLSDGFFWEVFAPALTSRRVDVLVRCFSLVERLLQSDSFSLIEGVRLRIVDGIAWEAEWHAVVQLYAGSLLRKELVSASGDNSWCEAPPDEPLLEADFAEGAYGPTILLTLKPVEGVSWLRAILDGLAKSTVGTVLRLDVQPYASISAAITEFNLRVVGRPPDRHLIRQRNGAIVWSGTVEEWETASLLIEPLLGQSGHQYLTSETHDDALIQVSVGE